LVAPATGLGAASPCPQPGPGADLAGCDLAGRNLTGVDLTNAILTAANLDRTKLAGAKLAGVTSGRIAGTPASLPASYRVVRGFVIGPGVVLKNANLRGANLAAA